jgi:hypothetical protein
MHKHRLELLKQSARSPFFREAMEALGCKAKTAFQNHYAITGYGFIG